MADVARSLLAISNLLEATGDTAGAFASCEEAILRGARGQRRARTTRSWLSWHRPIFGWASCRATPGIRTNRCGRICVRSRPQKLAKANPAVTALQIDLATSHNNIGNQLRRAGRSEDALRSYTTAVGDPGEAGQGQSHNIAFQNDLATSHYAVGYSQRESGHAHEALRSYTWAFAIRQRLADANPAVTAFQDGLAQSLHSLGFVQSDTGHSDDALQAYKRALEIYQNLADANPTVTVFQARVAAMHRDFGILQTNLGTRTTRCNHSHGRRRS